MTQLARYGWIPDYPDKRDARFDPPVVRLDRSGQLDPALMPAVFQQGKLGSCTGASTSRAYMYLIAKEGQPRNEMSALFAYYNGRMLEGTQSTDNGAMIRDVIKGTIKYGICAEKLYPYDPGAYSKKPSDKAYKDAHFTVLESYERIDGNRSTKMKTAIAQGWPVVFGFTVYSSFESEATAQTGVVRMPDLRVEKPLGGHAVWAHGWDDGRGFRIRNSWGTDFGINGDFWMPFEYIDDPDLAEDFWVLKSVS